VTCRASYIAREGSQQPALCLGKTHRRDRKHTDISIEEVVRIEVLRMKIPEKKENAN
jgi:hypothetical protein